MFRSGHRASVLPAPVDPLLFRRQRSHAEITAEQGSRASPELRQAKVREGSRLCENAAVGAGWAEGEAADAFASANMEHPEAVGSERGRPVVLFARNRLCAIARPGLDVSTDTLLDRMLDPAVKLGTSTPGADPAGDYAFVLFARAEALRPGARAALEAKALRPTGGPDSARPPPGRDPYAWQSERGAADLFLTYCTNAALARAADPSLRRVAVSEALSVAAEYGLVVLSDRPEAARLALFVLSPGGQVVLARHGFEAPALPATARPGG